MLISNIKWFQRYDLQLHIKFENLPKNEFAFTFKNYFNRVFNQLQLKIVNSQLNIRFSKNWNFFFIDLNIPTHFSWQFLQTVGKVPWNTCDIRYPEVSKNKKKWSIQLIRSKNLINHNNIYHQSLWLQMTHLFGLIVRIFNTIMTLVNNNDSTFLNMNFQYISSKLNIFCIVH